MNDAETLRGHALATEAARSARERDRRRAGMAGGRTMPRSESSGGWEGAFATLFHATGVITNTVEHPVLTLIALLIVAGVAVRVWSTLMGRAAPASEPGLPLSRWQGLAVRDIGSGRAVGRVRRLLYDPRQVRVVGIQTGGSWSWRVAPLTAVRGVGP